MTNFVGMKPLLRALQICVTLAMLPLLGGCLPHYTLNGASIDYGIYKTIHVSEFPIRAALVYPPYNKHLRTNYLTI